MRQRAPFGAPCTKRCESWRMLVKNSMTRSNYRCLEEVVGCKWSVSVLEAIASGVVRPGALERQIAGISTKVLSERLRKLAAYGLVSKHSYAELPPRTEYALTPRG